jgi:lipopolysaccharide export system protein LptA
MKNIVFVMMICVFLAMPQRAEAVEMAAPAKSALPASAVVSVPLAVEGAAEGMVVGPAEGVVERRAAGVVNDVTADAVKTAAEGVGEKAAEIDNTAQPMNNTAEPVNDTTQQADNTAQPIDISAKGLFQWNREGRFYLAKDEAVVKQGTLSLSADEIKAIYVGDDPQDISSIIVTGGIVVSDPPYRMVAEKGVYDVKAGVITFTGEGLELRTASEVVSATEEMVYRVADNRFTAKGNAKAVRGEDILTAGEMFAIFTRDDGGALRLRQLQAKDNVRLTNGREIVTGDEAVYDTVKQAAVLTGKVQLKQGESWLLGTRADVNLKTGISTLFADKKGDDADGRVRGTFYPKGRTP